MEDYSVNRPKDAHAICDLALNNYVEVLIAFLCLIVIGSIHCMARQMRSKVNSSWFMFRKKIHNALYKLCPDTLIPLYSMVSALAAALHSCAHYCAQVSFSNIPYSEVIERAARQEQLVSTLLLGAGVVGLVGVAALAARFVPIKIRAKLDVTVEGLPGWLANRL